VTGGEDYELLVCVPPGAPADAAGEAADITWIGTVTDGPAGLELAGAGELAASWRGHDHRL
jgi:thiamine monophosphate kinase